MGPTPDIDLNGNIGGRTLPATAAISDYGFGKLMFGGVYTDPAVTDADLRIGAAISAGGVGNGGGFLRLSIEDCAYSHVSNVIALAARTGVESYRDCKIARITGVDLDGRGFLLPPLGGGQTADIEIDDCIWDADPYHTHANRGANGAWTSGANPPIGEDVGDNIGVKIRRSTYRNPVRPLGANNPAAILQEQCVYECDPAARGFSAGNKWIGEIPLGQSARYIIKDCDPTSANFGKSRTRRCWKATPCRQPEPMWPVTSSRTIRPTCWARAARNIRYRAGRG